MDSSNNSQPESKESDIGKWWSSIGLLERILSIAAGIYIVAVILFLWFQHESINTLETDIGTYKTRDFKDYTKDPSKNTKPSPCPEDPSKLLNAEKDLVKAKNDFSSSLAQSFGSLFFLLTGYLAWKNFKVAQENLKVVQKNLQISEDKQVSERFGKAVDHLGDGTKELKLGGIYELQGIAQDSKEKYCIVIIKTLMGFVRESRQEISSEREIIPTYILTAIDVFLKLYNSLEEKEKSEVKLNLRGANFTNMILANEVNFTGFNLQRAKFNNADLTNANLSNTDLTGANFSNATLTKIELKGVDLTGAKFDWAVFKGADLTDANLTKADLTGARFEQAVFTNTDLTNADLTNADLRETIDLKSAKSIENSILTNAQLQGLELQGVNFQGVELKGANLTGVDLTGADLTGVDLTEATGLTQEQINKVTKKDNCKLPSNLT
jgi:uncharacterized protein YjbI with pentapeptide repeats